jgi:hypothetical protein
MLYSMDMDIEYKIEKEMNMLSQQSYRGGQL